MDNNRRCHHTSNEIRYSRRECNIYQENQGLVVVYNRDNQRCLCHPF